MAINYSEKQKIAAYKNFYGNSYQENKIFINYLLKKKKLLSIYFENFLNKYKKKFYKGNKLDNLYFNNSKIKINIHQNQLNKDGFTFIENFFDDKTFKMLKNIWPPDYFFYSPDSPLKNYKFGLRYLNNNYETKKDFEKCINFKQFYDYLLSNKFENFISKIITDDNYKIFSIVASIAKEKSFLIPHQDTVLRDNEIKNIVNVIYFVEGGSDPATSGGTGIYKNSEFNSAVFIPNTIQNSALIYNSKKELFHGFNFMKKNMFRKAVSFQLKKN